MREWLKEKRLERGLTMAQLAEKIGITESYYSYIEAGERQKKMDITLAIKLSTALDMPFLDVLEREGVSE